MFDHIGLTVADFQKSRAFYTKALAPLGYRVLAEYPGIAGFGDTMPKFWIGQGNSTPATPRVHVAFSATRPLVDKFYDAAMAAGAVDNGAPGLRPLYHEHYYGAFVVDPDGHNVEAVSHTAPASARPKRAAKKKSAATKKSAKKAPAKKKRR